MATGTAKSVIRVPADDVREACATALRAHGATASDATIQAQQLLEAELRGHSSHGIRRLPVLVARLAAGLIVSGVDPDLVWSGPASLQVDGRNGFGPVVAFQALDAVLSRVHDTGVAVAAVRRAHHLGILSPYVEKLAINDCIGIMLTTSEALVHPWGGFGRLVGTNPIAIAVPTDTGTVSLDMSTAAVSAGKILDYAARGVAIPEGWAVDATGRPTTDSHEATQGAISPFGGPKGYALGITLESLVGLLTRTSFGVDVAGTLDAVSPTTKGDVVIAISLAAFGVDRHNPELARYLDSVRASGVDGYSVGVPGDRARRSRDRALKKGLSLDAQAWSGVLDLAETGASR